jgi:hypothetical protein
VTNPGDPIAARRRIRQLILAAAAGAAILGYIFTQERFGERPTPQCLFRRATGWHCPGCGSGRAVHAILHARPLTAWRANPLLVVALPALAWIGLRWAGDVLRRRAPRPALTSLRPRSIYLIAAVVMAYWIARNLPWWPLTLLAPRA